ncbi:gas vesicle protein GvpO [Halococcus sediminicola]|uniref:gas vesicle protein GvpO n=1 Tax=Halococcus sediminicola TaxID=1264579 RepID=UPI00067899DC|nr:gas vesicle protein [Halococcus sediminicola]
MTDIDPSEYTVDELRDELDSIDDGGVLREVREAESDGKNRSGAKEAIAERLETVSDDGAEASEGENDDDDADETNGNATSGVGIVDIRNNIRDAAADLIGRPLDSVVEIGHGDDGWHAIVEIIERRSVPDTQDILGRYTLELDEEAAITGYRRLDRYRRGDTRSDEEAAASAST